MLTKLSAEQMKYLLSQSETGMGYQEIEYKLLSYSYIQKRGLVLNSELLIDEDGVGEIRKTTLKETVSYELLLEKAHDLSSGISNIRVIEKKVLRKYMTLEEAKISKGQSAEESGESLAAQGEIFKRFTAYKNDHRVTLTYGLKPGAYATTEDDAKNVRTGLDATARYTLPYIDPVRYVFTITPPVCTSVKRGTVQPAHNQPGGGVEVIFIKGSPDKTVTGPAIISEK